MKKDGKKIIIALAGHPASGKGEVVKYLEKKYRVAAFRFSTILRDMLKRIYLPDTRKNMAEMSLCLRRHFGHQILAKTIAKDIANIKSKVIVIDGVRRYPELKYLKMFDNFHLIRIVANSKIRFARLIKRHENPDDAQKTFAQFLKDHKFNSDKDVTNLMKRADIEINNDGSLNNLHEQIDKIIKNPNDK